MRSNYPCRPTVPAQAYARTRAATDLLARPKHFDPRAVEEEQDFLALLPTSAKRAYDVRPLVKRILDDGSPDTGGFVEPQA
jgi:acetyl-CoA/propionyl-CoA carboxylase carboxyl transferase subunit